MQTHLIRRACSLMLPSVPFLCCSDHGWRQQIDTSVMARLDQSTGGTTDGRDHELLLLLFFWRRFATSVLEALPPPTVQILLLLSFGQQYYCQQGEDVWLNKRQTSVRFHVRTHWKGHYCRKGHYEIAFLLLWVRLSSVSTDSSTWSYRSAGCLPVSLVCCLSYCDRVLFS